MWLLLLYTSENIVSILNDVTANKNLSCNHNGHMYICALSIRKLNILYFTRIFIIIFLKST